MATNQSLSYDASFDIMRTQWRLPMDRPWTEPQSSPNPDRRCMFYAQTGAQHFGLYIPRDFEITLSVVDPFLIWDENNHGGRTTRTLAVLSDPPSVPAQSGRLGDNVVKETD